MTAFLSEEEGDGIKHERRCGAHKPARTMDRIRNGGESHKCAHRHARDNSGAAESWQHIWSRIRGCPIGRGLLEDAVAAECCGRARHRSFYGNPGPLGNRSSGGSCPRSGDQDGAGPRRRKTGPTLSWAPAIGAMAERVSWTEPLGVFRREGLRVGRPQEPEHAA